MQPQTTITVGKTYADIDISPDVTNVTLPNDFDYPIRPGTFGPAVTRVFTGHAFSHELEPGVVHKGITHLVLGSSYEHPIKPESIPNTVKNLYIYDGNRDLAPTDRPFYLYRKYNTGLCSFTTREREKWTTSSASYYPITACTQIWAYLITPTPVPTQAISLAVNPVIAAKQQIEIDQTKKELAELKADMASIKTTLAELQRPKPQQWCWDPITKSVHAVRNLSS